MVCPNSNRGIAGLLLLYVLHLCMNSFPHSVCAMINSTASCTIFNILDILSELMPAVISCIWMLVGLSSPWWCITWENVSSTWSIRCTQNLIHQSSMWKKHSSKWFITLGKKDQQASRCSLWLQASIRSMCSIHWQWYKKQHSWYPHTRSTRPFPYRKLFPPPANSCRYALD